MSLNNLSFEIRPVKSNASRGELFNITIDGIFAAFAAMIPNGAFSTIIIWLEEYLIFSLFIADLNGAGSGLSLPSKSSPLIITLNLSFPKFLSIIVSTSFLEEPLTIA